MIESNHKLLESISRKNLADTPAQLQCMMLCLQGYDFTICYHPGKEMVIPDTLSRFSSRPGPDLPLDIDIHHACIMPDCKEVFQQAFVNDPEQCKLLPTSSSQAGLRTSRRSLIPSVHTGNTEKPSPSRMA